MKPDSDEDPDDAALFRAAMLGVQKRPATGRIPVRKPPPPPRARQTEADDRAVLAEMMEGPPIDSGDELAWRGNGIQDSVFRRLRRGLYRCGAELDLHGLRAGEAKHEVAAFLADCRASGFRCVRIIHGKGLRSTGPGPVLKNHLEGWLRRRSDVLAYCSARPADGGTGAVYVLLRTQAAADAG